MYLQLPTTSTVRNKIFVSVLEVPNNNKIQYKKYKNSITYKHEKLK